MGKNAKGAVSVQCCNDRLRLVWSYGGKRHYMYLGLADSRLNRIVAEGRAKQIEADLVTGNFDPLLEKYKPESKRKSSLLVKELVEKFLEFKSKRVHPRTAKNYKTICYHTLTYLGEKQAAAIGHNEADKFWGYLQKQESVSVSTAKEIICFAGHCWDWGIRQKLVSENLWKEIHASIKIPPRQRPKPFNRDEILQILAGFRAHPQYRHYADFVEFMFSTGCRTGEASALRWKHVSDDCSTIWIGESQSRGSQGATKTWQERYLPVPANVQAILIRRKPENLEPEGIVFPAPKGGLIGRCWIEV